MKIIKKHLISKDQAIKKIDNFLIALIDKEFPAGVKIKDPQKDWSEEDTMDFTFKVKKWVWGTKISGTVQVTDTEIIINFKLPKLITTFVSERSIKRILTNQLKELF